MSITGQCHCGAVSFTLEAPPKSAVSCNCSLCRRVGAVWIHTSEEAIDYSAENDATIGYVWGGQNIETHSCKKCGTTTHWRGIADSNIGKIAVNLNLFDLKAIESVNVREFDGADTWKFID